MIIYPYKNGSEGAKSLADALGVKQIKKEGSKFRGGPEKLVINWGNSMSTDEVDKCAVLNKPAAVAICSNKLNFFRHIQKMNAEVGYGSQVFYPAFGTSLDWAKDYINAEYKVVCRTVLNGHSGEGIVIASTNEELVKAPLYTVYQPKKSEYRVHVLAGQVVDVQRKARDRNIPDDQVNWQVRNHQFGFIFVRDDDIENIPRGVLTNALNAVKMCGLDFGAVDVIYNEKSDASYVLEINTAPGLTGTTLEGYQSRLKEIGNAYANLIAGKRKAGRPIRPADVMEEALARFVNQRGAIIRPQANEADDGLPPPPRAREEVVIRREAQDELLERIFNNHLTPAQRAAQRRLAEQQAQAARVRWQDALRMAEVVREPAPVADELNDIDDD